MTIQRFLVGGAVRDQLLGLPVHERDWVVVGATATDMVHQGFRLKDKVFQVYLHPETGDEHALARTETKSGSGHRGFVLEFGRHVTLEQDLGRRDLTVNAIAQSESGEIFDPYDGREALKARTLRHVSKAFSEDPLRVLRCGQFLARLAPLGFRVDEETRLMMRRMASSGSLDELSNHRVWNESAKALRSRAPSQYFELLFDLGLSNRIVSILDDIAASAPPVLARTLQLMDESDDHQPDAQLALAYVVAAFARIQVRLKTTDFPLDVMSKAGRDRVLTASQLAHAVRDCQLHPSWLLDELVLLDAIRRPERLAQAFETAAEVAASALGSHSLTNQCTLLREAAKRIQTVRLGDNTTDAVRTPREALRAARLSALKELLAAR
jgi:tRNA nucleotidyltransferase (CCA-adding enzyme)